MKINILRRNSSSHTAFQRLVGDFTNGQVQRNISLHYMVTILVYENMSKLRTILVEEVTFEKPEKTKEHIVGAQQYLQFYYTRHIGCDDDPLHSTTFALSPAKK